MTADMTQSVCLALAWEPRGEHERLERLFPLLMQWYAGMVVCTPPNPAPEALGVLRSLPGVQIGARDKWGSGRMVALDLALRTGADFIHYVDGDRLIRWVEVYPDELRRTVEAVRTADYLVLGRTPAAMATHPQALQKTETVINDLFSHFLGQPLDLCGGSKGLSRAAVEFLLGNADLEHGLGSDAEWAVLLHRGGFPIHSLLVDGLDWETADRYLPQAADAETQRRLADAYDTDPAHWEFRTQLLAEIVRAGLAALTRPLKVTP